MDRRTALRLLVATSACAMMPGAFGKTKPKIVVIGAGIVGAATAYFLSKAGAAVTVIDKQSPASHASRGTFAWLNATWAKQPKSYHHFNQVGLSVWREVQRDLGIPVRWNGSLEWFAKPERNLKLMAQIDEQRQWGEPAEIISADRIRKIEPGITVDDTVRAAYSPNDGAVDPVLATHTFLNAAKSLGAQLIFPCQAIAARYAGGRIIGVSSSQGDINADYIVVATGADPDIPEALSGLSIPQRTTPGVITLTHPFSPVVNTIVAAPGVHLHQRPDGRIVLGEQAGPPDGEAHEVRLRGRPNDFPAEYLGKEHGNRILSVAQQFFPALRGAEIDTSYIGWRPLPLDGHPVMGTNPATPGVYLAIMHSGVTLAPLVGKLITRELLTGDSLPELAAYRPTRQFEQVVRY
ncbi:FAD-binding oxidoreductase [Alteromonas aestuariivivens]|uniref:FAD-binding oxidoreductase n=1 Tax=Alteromonas aestuariivivens TaxID=1938339 RepID=A0A3D8M4M4_9ALTE|nr:FAD-dependent oxidoreductase [Alteromonas aestuariivivens]RDV24092.1 FAD-binding oxidoreductase [Alteromonas aestuariivivens]